MSIIVFILKLYLAAVLGVAGLAKLADRQQFFATITSFQILPSWSVILAGTALPWLEIVIAVELITDISPILTALTTFVLFTGFLILKIILAATRKTTDCGCFGTAQYQMKNGANIVVSSILAALAAFYVWATIQTVILGGGGRLAGMVIFGGAAFWLLLKRRGYIKS